jgi:hypothetical protein
LSFSFDIKNNNVLQLRIILNIESSVLESFSQIFGMAGKQFQKKLVIKKVIN